MILVKPFDKSSAGVRFKLPGGNVISTLPPPWALNSSSAISPGDLCLTSLPHAGQKILPIFA